MDMLIKVCDDMEKEQQGGRVTEVQSPFFCSLCGQRFSNSSILSAHVKAKHTFSPDGQLWSREENTTVLNSAQLAKNNPPYQNYYNPQYLNNQNPQFSNYHNPTFPSSQNYSFPNNQNPTLPNNQNPTLPNNQNPTHLKYPNPPLQNYQSPTFLNNQNTTLPTAPMQQAVTQDKTPCKDSCNPNSSSSPNKIVRVIDTPAEEIVKGARLYKCSECGFANDHTKSLYAHMQKKHKGFTIKRKLEERLSETRNKKEKNEFARIKKQIVTVVYTSVEQLQEGGKMYKCSACSLTSDDTDSLYRHMESDHEGFTIQRLEGLAKSLWEEVDLLYKNSHSGGGQKREHIQHESLDKNITTINTSIEYLHNGKNTQKYGNMAEGNGVADKQTIQRRMSPDGENDDECEEEDLTGNENEIDTHANLQTTTPSVFNTNNNLMNYNASGDSDRVKRMVPESSQDSSILDSEDVSHSGERIVTVIRNSAQSRFNGELAYKCSECGMASDCTSNLYTHMKTRHKGLKIEMSYSSNIKETTPPTCMQDYTKSLYNEVHSINKQMNFGETKSAQQEDNIDKGVVRIPEFQNSHGIANGMKPYKCSSCDFCYGQVIELCQHMEMAHPDLVVQKSADIGSDHLPDQISNEENKVTCVSEERVVRAIAVKTRIGFRYKCSKCIVLFRSRGSFYKHARRFHKDFDIAMRMAKKFTPSGKSRVPIVVHDKNGVRYKCSLCGIKYTSKFRILWHMKTNHRDEGDFESMNNNDIEEIMLRQKAIIDSGKYVEAIDIPDDMTGKRYKCSLCEKRSETTGGLYFHMRSRHKGFPILKKTVVNGIRVELNEVEEINEQEEEESGNTVKIIDLPVVRYHQFKCSRCNKTSHSTGDLYKHMVSKHQGLRMIKKTDYDIEPGEDTVQVINMQVAKNHHYKCSACDKTGDCTSSLYKHMALHHKGLKIIRKTNRNPRRASSQNKHSDAEKKTSHFYDTGVEKTVQIIDLPVVRVHQYKCSECDVTSDGTSALYKHMARHHKGFKVIKKTDIKKEKVTSGINDNYENQDEDEKQCSFKDDHDNLKQNQKIVQILDIPVVKVHQFKCSECSATSNGTTSLYKHMRHHHKGFRIIRKSELRKMKSSRVNRKMKSSRVSRRSDKDIIGLPGNDNDIKLSYLKHKKAKKIVSRKTFPPIDKPKVKRSQCKSPKVKRSQCKSFKADDMSNIGENADNGKISKHKDPRLIKKTAIKEMVNESVCSEDIKNVNVIAIPVVKTHHYKCSECDQTGDCTSSLYKHMSRYHEGLKIVKKAGKKKGKVTKHPKCDDYDHMSSADELDNFNKERKVQTVQVVDIPEMMVEHYKCSACGITSSCIEKFERHIKRNHRDLMTIKKTDMSKKMNTSVGSESVSDTDDIETQAESDEYGMRFGDKPNGSYKHGNKKASPNLDFHGTDNPQSKCSDIEDGVSNDIETSCDNKKTVEIVNLPVVAQHQYKCSECDKTSYCTSSLYKHMKIHHKGFKIVKKTDRKKVKSGAKMSEEFEQNDCNKEQKTVVVIDLPVVRVHKYKCSACGKTGGSHSVLYDHMKTNHKDLRVIKKRMFKMKRKVPIRYKHHTNTIENVDDDDDTLGDISSVGEYENFDPDEFNLPAAFGNSEKDSANILLDKASKKVHFDSSSRELRSKRSFSKRSKDGIRRDKSNEELGTISQSRYDVTMDSEDGFSNEEELNADISNIFKTDVSEISSFECCICMAAFASFQELDIHVQGHQDDEENMVLSGMEDTLEDKLGNLKSFDSPSLSRSRINHQACIKCKELCCCASSLCESMMCRVCTLEMMTTNTESKPTVLIIDIPRLGNDRYKCSECDRTSDHTGTLYKHMKIKHKGFNILTKSCIKKKLKVSVCCERSTNVVRERQDDSMERTSCAGVHDNAGEEQKEKIVYVIDIPNGENRYKCSECDLARNCTSILYKHMMCHHKGFRIVKKSEIKNKINASLCDEASKNDNNEDIDHNISSGIESGSVERFKQRNRRSGQMSENGSNRGHRITRTAESGNTKTVQIFNVSEDGNNLFECSECGKTSLSTRSLERHVRKEHRGSPIVNQSFLDKKKESFDMKQECTGTKVMSDNKADYFDDDYEQVSDDDDDDNYESSENENREISVKKGIEGDSSAQHDIGSTNSQCTRKKMQAVSGSVRTVRVVLASNSEGLKYKCSECDETSNYRNSLYRHMRRRHTGLDIEHWQSLDNVDPEEGENDSDAKTVQIIDVSIKGQNLYKCSECDVMSDYTGIIYKHMRTRHKGFRIIKRRKREVERISSGAEIKSSGDDCGRYARIDPLSVKNKKRWKCSLCSYSYTNDSAWDVYEHMRTEHNGYQFLKPSVATNVESDCLDASDISDDGVNETVEVLDISEGGVQRYQCSRCDETSYSVTSLYNHMRREHKKFKIVKKNDLNVQVIDIPDTGRGRYKCSECDKTAQCTGALYQHMRTKHKGFNILKKTNVNMIMRNTVGNLSNTVQVLDLIPNVGENRYMCSKCKKLGKTTSELYSHMKKRHIGLTILKRKGSTTTAGSVWVVDIIKNGEKHFKCSLCTFTCAFSSAVYRHMRMKHRDFQIIKKRGDIETIPAAGEHTENESDDEQIRIARVVHIIVNGKGIYKCSLCHFSRETTGPVFNHIRMKHGGFKIIKKIRFSELDLGQESDSDYGLWDDKMTDKVSARKTVEVLDLPVDEKGNRRYKCSKCSEMSNTVTNLYNHMNNEHRGFKIVKRTDINVQIIDIPDTGNGRYKCSECDKTGNEIDELYKHMTIEHESFNILKKSDDNDGASINNEYGSTSNCHSSADANAALDVKEAILLGNVKTVEALDLIPNEGKYRLKCSECGYRGYTTGFLYNHMKRKHKGFKILKRKGGIEMIPSGSEDTTDDEGINAKTVKVIDVIENGVRQFKCSLCFCINKYMKCAYRHMRKMHKGYKIIKRKGKSVDKGQGFVEVEDTNDDIYVYLRFKDHLFENDDNNKPLVDTQSALSKSKISSYECCVCMELFTSCEDLDDHVKSHSDGKPTGSKKQSVFDYGIVTNDSNTNTIKENAEGIIENSDKPSSAN